jgi:hypothetical protein
MGHQRRRRQTSGCSRVQSAGVGQELTFKMPVLRMPRRKSIAPLISVPVDLLDCPPSRTSFRVLKRRCKACDVQTGTLSLPRKLRIQLDRLDLLEPPLLVNRKINRLERRLGAYRITRLFE